MEKHDNQISVVLAEELRSELLDRIRSYGPIREDGLHELNERLYKEIEDFRVIFYSNESKHPGRPHCTIQIDGKTANYDLKSLEAIVGDLGRWKRTVRKVLAEHQEKLLQFWEDTRPDDQRLSK